MYRTAFIGESSADIKVEADSNEMYENPCDDDGYPGTAGGMFAFSDAMSFVSV